MGAGLPAGRGRAGRRAGTGRIYRLPADGGDRELVATVPGVVADGEGGLLGHGRWTRCTSTPVTRSSTPTSPPPSDNRIVRFHLDPDEPDVYDLEVGRSTASRRRATTTAARIAFGPDGMLYAGVGDAGDTARSQDPALPQRQDPADGPARQAAVADPNPDPESLVWSMGHRNVQGLAWDSHEPPLGHRVRAGHLRRGQPDRARQQLRLAGGRGRRRRHRRSSTR